MSEIDAILKLVVRNATLVNVLAQGFAEHAELLLQTRDRCCCTGCREAVTVRHMTLGLRCCDRCAARLIVKAKRHVGVDSNLDMNLLRGLVMQEDAWVDIPGAIGIRRAQDLVTMTGHGLEPDVPEPGSMEWQ